MRTELVFCLLIVWFICIVFLLQKKSRFYVIPCSNIAIVTIFHVRFMKSLEHLHGKVPDVPKDCLASACHRGHPALGLNSPTTVLQGK